jgi:predicted nucleotidyltransferase component of viral defense system
VERFVAGLRGRGLSRQKYKMTKNAIFAKFVYAGATVSFEAALRTVRSYVVRPFETLDGGLMSVNTLRPGDMVVEKVLAYKSRRKVRDLYDIFFLLQVVEERDGVERAVRKLLEDFKRPSDERALKAIILSGSVPSVESMLEGIEQWAG